MIKFVGKSFCLHVFIWNMKHIYYGTCNVHRCDSCLHVMIYLTDRWEEPHYMLLVKMAMWPLSGSFFRVVLVWTRRMRWELAVLLLRHLLIVTHLHGWIWKQEPLHSNISLLYDNKLCSNSLFCIWLCCFHFWGTCTANSKVFRYQNKNILPVKSRHWVYCVNALSLHCCYNGLLVATYSHVSSSNLARR